MFKLIILSLSAISSISAKITPPRFTPDFKSNVQSDVVVASGEYTVSNATTCCKPHTTGCQIQGIYSRDILEEQGTHNRSRRDTHCSHGPCTLASLYDPKILKQMMLGNGKDANSTHDYVCVEYCPLVPPFVSEVQIGDSNMNQSTPVQYLGKKTITQDGGITADVDEYQWSNLFFGIKLQTTHFYVDTTSAIDTAATSSSPPPSPFFVSQSIFTGLGIAMNDSYLHFEAANLTGKFDIDPASFATCPLSSGCSQNTQKSQKNKHMMDTFALRTSRRLTPSAPAPTVSLSLSPQQQHADSILPTFPKDYVVHQETELLSNSGGVFVGKDVCCSGTTVKTINGECLVTRSSTVGIHYVDVTNQRERFEDEISRKTMVTYYGIILKDVLVNKTKDGIEQCQEYCPLLPNETLSVFSLNVNATNAGSSTIDGVKVQHYKWIDYENIPIIGRTAVDHVDFYVGKNKDDASIPVFSTTKNIVGSGVENTTYVKFMSGTPDASKFQLLNLETCPQSKNCQIEKIWKSFKTA